MKKVIIALFLVYVMFVVWYVFKKEFDLSFKMWVGLIAGFVFELILSAVLCLLDGRYSKHE